jgi:hypothetical protein
MKREIGKQKGHMSAGYVRKIKSNIHHRTPRWSEGFHN